MSIGFWQIAIVVVLVVLVGLVVGDGESFALHSRRLRFLPCLRAGIGSDLKTCLR